MHPGYFKDQTVYLALKYSLRHEVRGSAGGLDVCGPSRLPCWSKVAVGTFILVQVGDLPRGWCQGPLVDYKSRIN